MFLSQKSPAGFRPQGKVCAGLANIIIEKERKRLPNKSVWDYSINYLLGVRLPQSCKGCYKLLIKWVRDAVMGIEHVPELVGLDSRIFILPVV